MLTRLLRYPVKGLPGQQMAQCAVEAGRPLPLERRWALTHGRSRFDAARPGWLPRDNFLNLATVPALARIECAFDPDSFELALTVDGETCGGMLREPAGRAALAAFLSRHLNDARGPLDLVESPVAALHDAPQPLLTLIGLPTIADLTARSGRHVDASRFRANLLIDGSRPWEELGWVGRTLRIGGATFEVVDRVERCAAIEVEPGSGRRAGTLLACLQRSFGHLDAGIYLRCIEGGSLAVHDSIDVR